MTEAESILDRALHLVLGGFPLSPLGVLNHLSDPDDRRYDAQINQRKQVGAGPGQVPPDSEGFMRATLALDSIAREQGAKNLADWWYRGALSSSRTHGEVVALFQDALFNVQIGG